jgi:Type II secretion system (T2SS), protein E, N-terminal domain
MLPQRRTLETTMLETVRIGEMLMALGACSPESVREALLNQAFFGGRLGTNLLRIGAVEEALLADALGRLHRVRSVSGEIVADPRALAAVPRRLVQRHQVVPYTLCGRVLRLVMRDPADACALSGIALATRKDIERIVAPEVRVWSLMREHYGLECGPAGPGLESRWSIPGTFRDGGMARTAVNDVS